ncbi:MAG: Ppx/GppA phosphatase family protein [Bacteriovoracia bacterium]
MRLAIIDLGTNSVRFDVHQIRNPDQVLALHREKLMVRLGEDVFIRGRLSKPAIQRTLDAFSGFKKTAVRLHASKIIAFGTSALREAQDAKKFISLVKKKTGIDIRVISGKEEATLISRGILTYEKPKGSFALVDIGGGSTEISICRSQKVLHADSFSLGTARLQQIFLKKSPPDPEAIRSLRRHIRSILLPTFFAEDWPKVRAILGSSGTVKSLARILDEDWDSDVVTYSALKKLIKKMSTMTSTELMLIPNMEPKRVDMILAGAILLEESMKALGAKKVIFTDFSLRDGILQDEVRRYKKVSQSKPDLDFVLRKAIEYGRDGAKLKKLVEFSTLMFRKLKRVHKLSNIWVDYLNAAVLLRDVGEIIAIPEHEKHSEYIVENLDFPAMQDWETKMIAKLVRYHEGGQVTDKDLKSIKDKATYLKLLALLRIVDAFDSERDAVAKICRVQMSKKVVKFSLGNFTAFERILLERKKVLFEEVFSRNLQFT